VLKKIICIVLTLMLPCAALAEYTMAGYDDSSTYRDWKTNGFFRRMEEKTGVQFTYRQYTKASDWTKAKAEMQAGSADLPDVLFKADLTAAECMSLLERGVLVDLKPYLEEYCPNLSALLAENPEYRQAITLPDGSIAALPAISQQPVENCVWLNRAWLDTLGLQMPQTAEELTEVLRAFKTGDPNRNGKADEIPLAFLGAFDLKFLGHAFGLIANDYNLREVNGQAQFVPLAPQFRPFVEWLRQLFSEGLLDPHGFVTSDVLRTVEKDTAVNRYGGAITTLPSNFLPTAWVSDYAVMPALQYNGQAVYRSFVGAVNGGTFAVTTACDNVGEILQWVDQFYTEEVYILSSVGQENVDYVIDGDGTWRMAANARNNNYFSSDTLIASGASYPCYATEDFQRRYYDQTVARLSDEIGKIAAAAQRPFPYYALDGTRQAQIAPLQSALGRMVDESIARWVTGETEISDESFAAFEKRLYDAGLAQFLSIWQEVLDGRSK
ncbi:MAG: extracellular solute-binding protein, partial [Clostridia bacterium]|nr:extracellular solute-binding protein [Clostridia bacterium]